MTKTTMLNICLLRARALPSALVLLSSVASAAFAQQARLVAPLPSTNNTAAALGSNGVTFGTVNTGNTSAPSTLTFTFTTAGSGVTVKVLTLGAINQDFVDAGTGTCTTNGAAHTYATGDTCSVVVTFSPRFNGPRNGAIVLANGTSEVATGYLQGYGYGPQIAYLPGTQSMVGQGFSGPNSVAVDGSGNVYTASIGLDSIEEYVVADGSTKTLGSGFLLPGGVAVDGAGNVYVADTYNNVVKEILASDGSMVTLGSGFIMPNSVAVDGGGNVYVADIGNNAVKEIVAVDGSVRTLGSGFNAPAGVAVDGSGNVYVAGLNDGTVKEIVAATGKVQTLGTGFNLPHDVAVDGLGNVYVTDTYNNAVKEISVTDGSLRTVGSGLNIPNGVTVAANGDVYIADYNNNRVVLVDVATPPVVTFATPTQAGTTDTADGAQVFTEENIGSAPLTLAAGSGTNPVLTSGFNLVSGGATTCPATGGTLSSTAPLASNASCSYAVTFTPATNGAVQGKLTLTDNNLAAFGTGVANSQIVLLNGTGIGTVTITVTGTLGAATVGTSYTGSFAGAGGTAPYTFSATGLPPGLSLSAAGALSGTPTTIGSYTLVVTAKDANGNLGSSSFPLSVVASTLDFQLSVVGTQTQTIPLSGTAQYTVSVSPATGSIPYAVSFTVSGIPTSYRAVFMPSSVTPGSSTVQTQLTIQPNTSIAADRALKTSTYGVMAGILLLPFLAASGVRRRMPHSLFSALLVIAGLATALSMSGCVATHTNAASYDVLVTASGGGHQHAVHVALSVQP